MPAAHLTVIFDLDGTLVDSHAAHMQSWVELARRMGSDASEATFSRWFGQRNPEIIRGIWGGDGATPLSEARISEMADLKERLYREEITRTFPAMPGADELLEALAADGVTMAIGSSAPPENVSLCIERQNWMRYFATIVTGVDVQRGKPDPQVFLLAAERLGRPAGRCVVVEDAAAGIEAAHRAGMAAVGLVSTGHTRQELARAELVIDSLAELDAHRLNGLAAWGREGAPSVGW